MAALFSQLHPIAAVPSSFFLGALLTGANKMQRVVQVPSALIGALNGLIVLLVVASEILRKRRVTRVDQTLEPSAVVENEKDIE
ncbi:MAG: ABC transporter permease [Lentisphaerae bacterium]|nr:ABC transporter permease [Lentisphaerota bacterium]